MKNHSLLGLMLLAGAFAVSGPVNAQEEQKESKVLRGTYYGSKFNKYGGTPCRGRATKVCGSLHINLDYVETTDGKDVYSGVRDVYDKDGNIVLRQSGEIVLPEDAKLENNGLFADSWKWEVTWDSDHPLSNEGA